MHCGILFTINTGVVQSSLLPATRGTTLITKDVASTLGGGAMDEQTQGVWDTAVGVSQRFSGNAPNNVVNERT